MTILSTTLIAAAGNAAGASDYWVNEIIPPDTATYITRVAVNPSKQTIMLGSNRVDAANRVMYEFDYDGNILRQGQFTPVGSGRLGYSLVKGMNNQYLDANGGNNTSYNLNRYDSASSGNVQKSNLNHPYSYQSPYYDSSYHARSGFMYSDDNYCLSANGGYESLYYTGIGYYFKAMFGVKKITYTSAGTAVVSKQHYWPFSVSAYSDSRQIQVSNKSSGGYHIVRGWEYNDNKLGWGLVDGPSDSINSSLKTYNSGSRSGIEILVDSTDKFFDVVSSGGNAQVFRNPSVALPTGYNPTIYYSISGAYGGIISGAALDSSDNLYLLWSEGTILKFNSSMVYQWGVRVRDTQSSVESTSSVYTSFNIETIGEEDIIFATFTQASKSGQSTKNLTLFKLPVDLDQYIGTYGNYEISAAPAPQVSNTGISTGNINSGNTTATYSNNFNSFSNSTVTNVTVTNTTI